MKTQTLLIAIAAAAALAGCNKENHTLGGDPAADANATAAAPVALPPSIAATKTYRCADNAVVSVDWLSDNLSATIRAGDKPAAQVTTAEAGKPMTAASGYALSGTANAPSVRITVPGHASQSCKA